MSSTILRISRTAAILLLALAVCPWCVAADDESGFMRIFNGRDLEGWDGAPGVWSVEDGAIRSHGPDKTWLVWRGGEVADFELRLSFRHVSGNSGVQVRSEDRGVWQVHGYQVEVAARDEMGLWHESLWTDQERRFLAIAGQRAHIAPDGTKTIESIGEAGAIQAAFKPEDWNEMTVLGRGKLLVQKINGVVFAELIDEHRAGSRSSGVIALQHTGNKCVAEFKDIRLKRLAPE